MLLERKETVLKVLCHYGVKGQKWGVRRTPEQLGHKPPVKALLEKSLARSTIVQDAIRSGEVSKLINREKQTHHTFESHLPGRSYIHGDLDFCQKLIDELSGKGEPVIVKGDTWTKRERVTASEIIGTHVDPSTGVETKTKVAMIVYSKTGTHIYPRKEKK